MPGFKPVPSPLPPSLAPHDPPQPAYLGVCIAHPALIPFHSSCCWSSNPFSARAPLPWAISISEGHACVPVQEQAWTGHRDGHVCLHFPQGRGQETLCECSHTGLASSIPWAGEGSPPLPCLGNTALNHPHLLASEPGRGSSLPLLELDSRLAPALFPWIVSSLCRTLPPPFSLQVSCVTRVPGRLGVRAVISPHEGKGRPGATQGVRRQTDVMETHHGLLGAVTRTHAGLPPPAPDLHACPPLSLCPPAGQTLRPS